MRRLECAREWRQEHGFCQNRRTGAQRCTFIGLCRSGIIEDRKVICEGWEMIGDRGMLDIAGLAASAGGKEYQSLANRRVIRGRA